MLITTADMPWHALYSWVLTVEYSSLVHRVSAYRMKEMPAHLVLRPSLLFQNACRSHHQSDCITQCAASRYVGCGVPILCAQWTQTYRAYLVGQHVRRSFRQGAITQLLDVVVLRGPQHHPGDSIASPCMSRQDGLGQAQLIR
jgi:hypothetical protein